ncbi:monooxygenase [Subtercola boreus]|uniref:Monooxygenase n=1 Tax=Subtercola boreus TaxID=120213 RepID=A0A3E0VGJ0_9MICO|nr:NAD(P)/FAD-dependent oxidoreductase [Subtercola boreus]RFA08755.1 monooxygenase [Subtercola boreus]TQL54285.1 flavin-dependent dehydrogenase [Subtercola boreus]
MQNPDVLVVGGGPVGLAAAIGARLAGLRVLVVEPRTGPVDKACGEGLMPGALAELERLGVRPHGHPIAGIGYHDGARAAQHLFRGASGRGVRRTELSRALHERAAELGVERLEGRVVEVAQDARGVGVTLGDGSGIRSRWLIGCDGLHSGIRRLVGLEVPAARARRYGLRRHYRLAPWSDAVEVFWSGGVEVYVTPVAEGLIGVAMLGPRGMDYEGELARIPELAERLNGAEPAGPVAGAGPLRQRVKAHASGRVLLAGDASGYLDALTGEGMRIGFAQAAAAVRVIAGAHDTPEGEAVGAGARGVGARAAAQYEREWRRASGSANRFTAGLLLASQSPVRRMIVPVGERMPGLFSAAVEVIAR